MVNLNLLLVIIIILVLYYLINGLIKKIESFTEKNNQKMGVNIDIKNKIIYGLSVIDKIFNKHNIYYTVAYGTLLGAVRHHDMIPWDDDGDINVLRQDYNKIISLKDEFKQYGLIMDEDWKLIKIYFDDSKYPFIDLFINDNEDGKLVRCMKPYDKCNYIDKNNDWWWKWINYSFEWIEERKRFKFGNIEVWGPAKPDRILKYWYGDDCLTKCETPSYDHTTAEYIKAQEINCGNLPEPQI
jgi:hypothetical protein